MENVCLNTTPYMSGKAYVEHMLVCPYKTYERQCPKLINTIIKQCDIFVFQKQIKSALKKVNEKFIYMLTFTVDVKKQPMETKENIAEVENYIVKLLNSKSLKHIVKSHLVYEIGENGNHHWHAYAECTRCLKKDRFKTYMKRYGNIDISRNRSDNEETVLTYMSKSNTPTLIKNTVS